MKRRRYLNPDVVRYAVEKLGVPESDIRETRYRTDGWLVVGWNRFRRHLVSHQALGPYLWRTFRLEWRLPARPVAPLGFYPYPPTDTDWRYLPTYRDTRSRMHWVFQTETVLAGPAPLPPYAELDLPDDFWTKLKDPDA